jgi:flagellar motor switch protein FliG
LSAAARLSGAERAALVVLGLDEGLACQILRHLPEGDVRRLLECVDTMTQMPVEALEPAFEDFERELRAPVPARGGGSYLRKLANAAIGAENVQRLLSPPPGPPRPIDTIKSASAPTLATLLEDEHPQVAAVLLSQLPREQAAKVLGAMPKEVQVDLLARVAGIEDVPAPAVEMASEALAKALAASGALSGGERTKFDGVAFTAAVLNELPATDSEHLLTTIGERDEKLGTKVREAMFTFEDLGRLGARGLQTLMREVPSETLLMALKTAAENLRDQFLAAISARAAEQLRDDLALLPPTRLSDVERAQKEIVEIAMRLSQEGRLQLPSRGGEKLV